MEPVHVCSNETRLHLRNIKAIRVLLLLLNCILLSIGQVGGPLLVRLYFLHGGKRRWLTSWLLTAGFPIMFFPVAVIYTKARSSMRCRTNLFVTPRLVAACALLGLLLGLCSYLYSFGMSYLPVSVSSLLSTSQLPFTAIFAFIMVRHKFTHYSINAVVLMTFGSLILGLHMDGDRPVGVSSGKYMLGFLMTLAGAALHGFILPALEYTNSKAGSSVSVGVIMQIQLLIAMFATLFCTVPMIVNKDFQAIPKEAAEFGLGESKYYLILISAALTLQFNLIGNFGVIYYASSLFGGIVSSLLVPVQQIFAVILLPESLNAEKGMALAMCLWGFASYFYGEHKVSSEKLNAASEEPEKQEQVEIV